MSIKYIERDGALIEAVSGKAFKHNGSKADRARALKELEVHQRAELEKHGLRAPMRRNEQTSHPETRTKQQLLERRKQLIKENSPKPPRTTLDPDVNPIRRGIEIHVAFKGPVWAKSRAGRDWITEREAEAVAWDRQHAADKAEQKRQESIADMVSHALRSLDSIRADPSFTVEEVEAAEERYRVAQTGDYQTYERMDREFRDAQRAKIEAQAHQIDDQIRTLAGERDQLLSDAWRAEPPVPQPKPIEQPPQVDLSRRAIEYGHDHPDPKLRGKTIIVRADDPRAIAD
jgi:hypothetical protein